MSAVVALDAGDGHGHAGVGDDEVLSGERDLLGALADGEEPLTAGGQADDDLGPGQFVQVEDMRRLAELEQHEVARVDDIVARDQVDRPQPVGHPVRRRADRDAADEPRRVQGAQLRLEVGDGYRQTGGRPRGGRGGPGRLERAAGDGRDLSSQADVADAVAPVGGHLVVLANVRTVQRLSAFKGKACSGQQIRLLVGVGRRIQVVVHPVGAGVHGGLPGSGCGGVAEAEA
jgi:hypothetical protein